MHAAPEDNREAYVRMLWRTGKDTMDIAYVTELPQDVVERAVNRMLDEQYRNSCPAR